MSKKAIGVAAMCAAIVLTGVAATDPLVASSIGVFEIMAQAQDKWDPTWNDDDVGISAFAGAVLLLLLTASGGIGVLISRAANLPARRTVWVCVLGTLVIAAIGGGLVTGV